MDLGSVNFVLQSTAGRSPELEEHLPASSKLDAGNDHDENQTVSHDHQSSGSATVGGIGTAGPCDEPEIRAASQTLVTQRE